MSTRPVAVPETAVAYAAAVLDAHPEPIAILVDGLRLRAANPAFLELMSATMEDARGRTLEELGLRFSDDSGIEPVLGEVLASGTAVDDLRIQVRARGRRLRTLSLTARRIQLDGERHDGILVTLVRRGRWRADSERHRHNVALLKSISASTWDVILTLSEEGVVETASATMEAMFGYSPSEAVGMDLGKLISEPAGGERLSRIRSALRAPGSGGKSPPAEFIGVRRDGSRIPVEVSISEIDDEQRFTCMIRDVSERKRLEQQILDISTEEQRRIGLELHDDTLQAFTGMQFVAEELVELLEPGSRAHELARTLAGNNAAASRRARLLARGLVSARIPPGGLLTALETLAADIGELHGARVSVEYDDLPLELANGEVATHIYRIVQEAAGNAARHSGSERVTIRVVQEAEQLVIRVSDSGTGFVREEGGDGLGLKIMAYRADLIGAELSIENWRSGGTVVVLSVPFARWDAAAAAGTAPRPEA